MTFDWLLAVTPILLVLFLMLVLRWKGTRAGPIAWLAAIVIAALRFGAGLEVLVWAQIKGVLLSLWVLYVILAALVFYRVTDEAGAIETIGADLPRLTANPSMQALLLGWVFGGFLQGISGFGVPVAVLGPLLVGLGFAPVTAVVIASVGHSWAVTFGSLGSSFFTLMAATGRPGEELAQPSAAMLGLVCLLCGAGVLWASGGPRALWRGVVPLLLIGGVMATTQFAAASLGLWTVAALCGAIAGLAAMTFWLRRRGTREEYTPPPTRMNLSAALMPYILLVVIVLAAELIGPVNRFLGQVVLRVEGPELVTARGWIIPAGPARTIDIFGHGGALLIYASLITYLIYRKRGQYEAGTVNRIARSVWKRVVPTGIGIIAMVGMGVTMDHAGMTHLLANGISRLVGPAFPLASPFIGALGAFMTGSNTNSNVVFGPLQEQVAMLVGMSPLLALAAQTSGGAIGGMFAPAKVIVGCAPVKASEGDTMRRTMAYGAIILTLLAAVTLAIDLL